MRRVCHSGKDQAIAPYPALARKPKADLVKALQDLQIRQGQFLDTRG